MSICCIIAYDNNVQESELVSHGLVGFTQILYSDTMKKIYYFPISIFRIHLKPRFSGTFALSKKNSE